MRLSAALLLAALSLADFGQAHATDEPFHLRPRDYENRDYYAVHLTERRSPQDVARLLGLEYEGHLGIMDDIHMFSSKKRSVDVVNEKIEDFRRRRRKRDLVSRDEEAIFDSIGFTEKQRAKQLYKRLPPPPSARPPARGIFDDDNDKPIPELVTEQERVMKALDIRDPIFKDQWHLFNNRERGHDVNVTGLWLEGITGHNTTLSIVDDGLDMSSEDLKDNYFAAGSYDFNDPGPEPRPRLPEDRHGTRCAGEVAAVKNHACGVGVAYDSKVSGIRILSKLITDADEAVALNYAYHDNQIYSCSWGPPDDGRAMDEPGVLIKRAMVAGIQRGRHGLGSLFVFASGNGASAGDNCNFDGYTNSIYSITVGAIDRKGYHPFYAEECSANLVVTYSSGSGDAIHTTDVGTNNCYVHHGGTSAAAPLAAGIYGLVLSVRPDLTWRDLQYLTIDTAIPVNEDDEDWVTTAIGKKFNHKYGYGKLDAYTLVHAAKTFKKVKPQTWFHSAIHKSEAVIPTGKTGLTSTITVTKEQLEKANFGRLEHVTVTMNATHERRGDMAVDLVSPHGLVSHIAVSRPLDVSKEGYKKWTFMTVKHWGEDPVGDWRVIIRDTQDNDKNGKLIDWQLNLWGEVVDETKAKLHPLPGDKDEMANPDVVGTVSTTSLPTKPTNSGTVGNPSDAPKRPIKPSFTSSPGAGSSPISQTPGEDEDSGKGSHDRPAIIPGFLPNLGVSGKSQAWIYGAIVVILLFVAGLGVFLCVQRRKRTGGATGYKEVDDYEFEDLDSPVQGAPKGKGARKTRDLYDAFGASDDDRDMFSDDDDEGDEKYRDEEEGSVDESSSAGSGSGRNEKRT